MNAEYAALLEAHRLANLEHQRRQLELLEEQKQVIEEQKKAQLAQQKDLEEKVAQEKERRRSRWMAMVTMRRQRQMTRQRWSAGGIPKHASCPSLEIFLMAVFCSFSADSTEQVLATTESDMPADSEPLLVEVIVITI